MKIQNKKIISFASGFAFPALSFVLAIGLFGFVSLPQAKAGCAYNSDCNTGQVCDILTGICGACQKSSECDANKVCLNGSCVSSSNATTCSGSGRGSCPNANQLCQNGVCIDQGMQANPSDHIINPIPNQNSLTDLLLTIMKSFLGVIGIWAVAFIVFGGFKMVISQGNEEALTSAKKTVTWAIIGLLVAVLSFSIIAIVQNLIGVKVS